MQFQGRVLRDQRLAPSRLPGSSSTIRGCSAQHPYSSATPLKQLYAARYSLAAAFIPNRHCRRCQQDRPALAVRGFQCRAAVAKSEPLEHPPSPVDRRKWQRQVLFCAIALGFASIHRATFAILAVPFQTEFALSLPQMGVLQSAMLGGYVIGQFPSGLVADKVGGSPLMMVSLVAWCTASGLTPLARLLPPAWQLPFLITVRGMMGLAQSGIITSTSAMSARWVPAQDRSKALGFCYFLFSAGTVLAMSVTPVVAAPFGWPAAFALYSLLGFAWATWGYFMLPPEAEATNPVQAEPTTNRSKQARKYQMSAAMKVQVGVLVWTHSVIGYGFTLLQNWIPMVLDQLGSKNLASVGVLSALPWMAASGVSLAGGVVADWMHESLGWPLTRVRSLLHNLSTLGPSLTLLPLALAPQNLGVPGAVACLVSCAALQAFCYSGFHSYVQDVAPKDAGKLLGLTNTGGTILGFTCNILTGNLAAGSGGFASVFAIASAVYFSSFLTWAIFIKGAPIRVT